MTVHAPIERAPSDTRARAIDAVHRWRGHCVARYARLEDEVATTLTLIVAMTDEKLKVPHNFGDKVKTLRSAISPNGAFPRPKLTKAWDGFEAHLDRRNMLVHATGKVWTDAQGDWLWSYRFQPSGKGKSVEVGYIEHEEALQLEQRLARESQSLVDQMKALRLTLEAVTE